MAARDAPALFTILGDEEAMAFWHRPRLPRLATVEALLADELAAMAQGGFHYWTRLKDEDAIGGIDLSYDDGTSAWPGCAPSTSSELLDCASMTGRARLLVLAPAPKKLKTFTATAPAASTATPMRRRGDDSSAAPAADKGGDAAAPAAARRAASAARIAVTVVLASSSHPRVT